MTSRRSDATTVLLLAAAAAAILARLDRLPALTSDEAWIGLFALRVRTQGLFTPHEMNTYTGPLYGLLLAKIFALRGVSIGSLRLLGAGANVAALVLIVADLRRRLGAAAAAWTSAIFAGSAYFLLKSRLAWDVYALQPILLAATFNALDGPATFSRALLFSAATLIGVQNHFIYLSVPASLAALYGARAAWLGEDEARPWFRISTSALGAAAIVYLVKPRLAEDTWVRDRLWAVPLFAALAPLSAAVAVRGGEWESGLLALLRRPSAAVCGRRALTAGLAAFAVWHMVPLWSILADALVWRRLFSWNAPWWLSAPLGAWGWFLLALLAWRAVRAWNGLEPKDAHERTLALWPAFYAAIFILFRNTSSLRYYSIIQLLCVAGLGPALAGMAKPDRRYAAAFAAFAALAVHGVFWSELAAPADRVPNEFRIGWHSENSRDFARKDALFAAFDASGACEIAHQERSFVSVPLDFHHAQARNPSCDATRVFEADFCADCASPPFYRWSVISAAR